MTDNLIRTVLGEPEMQQVVTRLIALYRAATNVGPEIETMNRPPGLRLIDVAELAAFPPPSRMDCVLDRRSGLEYAAWCIGEALAACGGRDLLMLVYGMFEDQTDARGSSWLDHRWNGVPIPDGVPWTS